MVFTLHQLPIQFVSFVDNQAFLKLIVVISIAAKISDSYKRDPDFGYKYDL
jgi:hypothetical protein